MSDHELWNEVGNLYFKSGAYELAKNAYARAIDLDHAFGKPYANLGVANARLEKYADAIALYRKALELLDDTFDKAFTWYKLGNAYWDVEDYSLAMEAFHKADELLPSRNRDIVASPDMLLTSRRDVNEVLTILDLPEDDVPAIEPTAFIASASDFGRDAYLDDLSPWKFNESILTDEEPACPESEWFPLDETEDFQPGEEAINTEPLKWDVFPAQIASTESPAEEIAFDQTVDAEEEDSVHTGVDLPERFLQEYALGGSEVGVEINSEPALRENDSPVDVKTVLEPEEVILPVTDLTYESMAEDEAESVIAENHLVDFDASEANLSPVSNVEIEEVTAYTKIHLSAEIVALASDVESTEAEIELPSVIMAEPEVKDADVEAAEIGDQVEESESTEVKTEAFPVLLGDSDTIVITDPPEFVAQDMTDPEPVHYQPTIVETPVEDSATIWREVGRMKRVLEINPQNAFAWDTLGNLYKSLGQHQQAIDAHLEAVLLNPDKTFYRYHLGLAYAAEGRFEEAIVALEKVLEMNPDHGLAHATLGGYYRRQGLDELAQAHIEKAKGLLGDEENEYNRACMEAIWGNSDRALDLLEIALKNKQTYATWVRRDPDFDVIRSDARFEALLVEYEMEPAQ